MALKENLQHRIQGDVLDDPVRCQELSGDFGRMVFRMPSLIVRPKTAEDVSQTVRFAREKKLPLGVRGNAHTQSGQGLTAGGVLLDLTPFNRIHSIDPDRKRVELAYAMAAEELRAKRNQRASIGRSISRLRKALKQQQAPWTTEERSHHETELEDLLRETKRLDQEIAALNEHLRLLKIKQVLLRL